MNTLATSAALLALVSTSRVASAQYLQDARLRPSLGSTGTDFGGALDLDARTLVVGATKEGAVPESGAVYVYTSDGDAWSLQQWIQAERPGLGDRFGSAVALSGDWLLVSAAFDDDHGTNAGVVFAFERNGATWRQVQKLIAGDTAEFDGYGSSLAIDGHTAVVGAKSNDAGASTSGAAYVFIHDGSSWALQQKVWAYDAATFDVFGSSVDVSGDTLVVGSFQDDHDVGSNQGSAYVYVRSGASWSLEQKLVALDADDGDAFGSSVGIEGDTIVVGAIRDDDHGSQSGSAYVFERAGTSWTQTQKLLAGDGAAGDEFGGAVSISRDLLLIGARDHCPGAFVCTGATYLFERSAGTWAERQELVSVHTYLYDGGKFGAALALDGGRIAVGDLDEPGGATGSGAVFVFEESSPSGEAFCFGDGSGPPCPCGAPGTTGEGCANSGGSGAVLQALGSRVAAEGELVLLATQCTRDAPGIFFQGTVRAGGGSGLPFGDGLLCVGGSLVRLALVGIDGHGTARTTSDLAAAGGVTPGTTYHYQFWYRDSSTLPTCAGFNLTSGCSVTWL